ncbi:monooxygenase [Talaromyces pinophilus]|uniref:Monooxygenase n=1 Tax=Talaromyces pinophilus TaxID=128442 RepID=A0A6V8H8Z9_TALPI|nr:monooxygenase [Talaromyces pinophilus]
MPSSTQPEVLDIAIIGSGPGGLSAGIALSKLPNVYVRIFEKASAISDLGGGISINHNGWKVLEYLGARKAVTGASTVPTVQRNAYTGEVVDPGFKHDPNDLYQARRTRRSRLQNALYAEVPKDIVHFNKKLVTLENLEEKGVRLIFADGSQTTADIVVGGDGIRSVVRQHIYPDYKINYVGSVGWRTLVPVSAISHIPDISLTVTNWWRGAGSAIYMSPVDELSNLEHMEVSCRSVNEPEVPGETVSWGKPVGNEKVLSRFQDYYPRMVEVLKQVPEGGWKEFSGYAGPFIENLTGWDKLVLIGDASHPSGGGFGSGSAFAMEDSWILARSIEYSRTISGGLADALRIYNSIRAPYYKKMFEFRETQQLSLQKSGQKSREGFNERLRELMSKDGLGGRRSSEFLEFVYGSDVEKVWKEYLEKENASRSGKFSS